MAKKSYRARVAVLRKTKLGEKDLIVTMLDETGELRRAVAKGARKPGGSFAARLELFSVVDGWFVEGKTLDVITDARRVEGFETNVFGLEQTACASAIAELLCFVAQEGLAMPRMFDMTVLAFRMIAHSAPETAVALCAADLLKTLAIIGFRPSFDYCIVCGEPISWDNVSGAVRLSIAEGGVVCDSCTQPPDAIRLDARVVAWSRALMMSTFTDVVDSPPDVDTSFSVLQLVRQWTSAHVGKNIKSLDYLFASGLY